jgi:putative lipoprotein
MKSNIARIAVIAGLLAAVAFFHAGTPQAGESGDAAPAKAVHGFDYDCSGTAVTLRLTGENAAEVQIGGDVTVVRPSPAASGVRYTAADRGGDLSLHTKGDGAVLTRNGADTSCTLSASAAPATGEDQTESQAAVEQKPVSLQGTAWQLTTIEGAPLAAGTAADIRFDAGRAGGRGGCNSFGGSYTVEGDRLRFGDIMSTQMACDTPRMELELRVHDLLAKVDSYAIDESGALTLSAADKALLVYRPAAALEGQEKAPQ